ncbi:MULTISPECIES: Na+/H+ antiporter subunit E [unclassified Synechococcus]|jgi:multicomponent Na+:H+ antiporter subunit E|uniref:Na+/H+ antiporter subunit E n=1 Tax=unclassified Synechococcus TaxID=2626047 RepID=UPI000300E3B4|nr:Na+/H+ antiporter subunit E [Synechococcus sp. JA-2-3B'a(2-13)]MDT7945618.1 Na+/H+ antiporter subunit E [Cyanobacteriota bacterium PSP.bin.10]
MGRYPELGLLEIGLRLLIWFLLTGNLSWDNVAIGVAATLLLPRQASAPVQWRDWGRVLQEILLAIPRAYWEAFEMILKPHTVEEVVYKQTLPNRSAGLVFLDIFLITFTPKTIVLNCNAQGTYEVHVLKPREDV